MWLALLELPSPVEQQEALRGIARLVEEVTSVRTATALMLVAQLSRDDLWLRNFAIAPSVRILMRLADLNPAVRD
ncbi:MAG: hypothetical protein R3350_03925, partial [Saprospiraceae bacterium]|nr:hypothetical protein [Saprospiraceae bacterium]